MRREDIFIPIMLVLGIFLIIWLFIVLGTSFNINWEEMNPLLLELLPWLVVLGFAIFILVYVMGRK